MKRKFQRLFLPLALLFVFHLLHSPPAYVDNSLDSRYWSDPFVPLKDVVARIFT